MLMRFNLTIASLIWSITLLLFAVKVQKTAKVWLFHPRLDLQKAGVSAAESSSLAVFLLQITAKTATTPKGRHLPNQIGGSAPSGRDRLISGLARRSTIRLPLSADYYRNAAP